MQMKMYLRKWCRWFPNNREGKKAQKNNINLQANSNQVTVQVTVQLAGRICFILPVLTGFRSVKVHFFVPTKALQCFLTGPLWLALTGTRAPTLMNWIKEETVNWSFGERLKNRDTLSIISREEPQRYNTEAQREDGGLEEPQEAVFYYK